MGGIFNPPIGPPAMLRRSKFGSAGRLLPQSRANLTSHGNPFGPVRARLRGPACVTNLAHHRPTRGPFRPPTASRAPRLVSRLRRCGFDAADHRAGLPAAVLAMRTASVTGTGIGIGHGPRHRCRLRPTVSASVHGIGPRQRHRCRSKGIGIGEDIGEDIVTEMGSRLATAYGLLRPVSGAGSGG